MITQTVTIMQNTTPNIIIGRRGTYETQQVVFDVSWLIQTYGEGTAELLIKRPKDASAYPVVAVLDGNTLTWTVSETDTQDKGHGECEIYWYVNGGLAKSCICGITILRDIGDTTETAPDPYETWVDELARLGAETLANAQAAEQSANNAAQSASEADNSAAAALESEENAHDSENAAKASELAAAASAQGVEQYAASARQSATEAAQSATNAHDDATDASASADRAEQAAASIEGDTERAEAASESAREAASDASGFAGTASTKATEAAASATAAASSATAANTAKAAAETAQGKAEDAQTAAETAATNAQASADDAAQSAQEAASEILKAFPHDTASGSIAHLDDGAALPVRDLSVDIEPIQDLHGYDNPWPAGGGKNLLENTLSTTTNNGVTFTVNADGSMILNGTASAIAQRHVNISLTLKAGQYVVNGMASGGGSSTRMLYVSDGSAIIARDTGNGATFNLNEDTTVSVLCWVNAGQTVTNVTVKPMIRLASVSDDTFSPYSNICPISGWTGAKVTRTGKNLLAKPFAFRPVPSKLSDCFFIRAGTYTFSFESIGTATSWRFGVSMFDKDGNVLSDAMYAPSNTMNFVNSVAMWYTSYDVTAKTETITFVKDCYTRIWFGSGNTSSDMVATGAQLELGSTATDYEPYQGETYSITFPTEAGTVYGGTLDVTTGKMVVDRAMVDLGTLTWGVVNSNFFYAGITGMKANVNTEKCSTYATVNAYSDYNFADKSVSISQFIGRVAVHDSAYSDAAAFKTALSGVQLCYELATPIVYDLTPTQIDTLLGTNNVWSDTGDTTVDYYADPTLFVNKKIAAAVAAMS